MDSQAKTLALELFLALSEEERLDVLTKSKKGTTAAAKVAKEDSEPKASGSGESKKVKAVVDPAEAEVSPLSLLVPKTLTHAPMFVG